MTVLGSQPFPTGLKIPVIDLVCSDDFLPGLALILYSQFLLLSRLVILNSLLFICFSFLSSRSRSPAVCPAKAPLSQATLPLFLAPPLLLYSSPGLWSWPAQTCSYWTRIMSAILCPTSPKNLPPGEHTGIRALLYHNISRPLPLLIQGSHFRAELFTVTAFRADRH